MSVRTAVLPARQRFLLFLSISHLQLSRRTLEEVDALAVQHPTADFGSMLAAQELDDSLVLGWCLLLANIFFLHPHQPRPFALPSVCGLSGAKVE